jgi:hypothetical protein
VSMPIASVVSGKRPTSQSHARTTKRWRMSNHCKAPIVVTR